MKDDYFNTECETHDEPIVHMGAIMLKPVLEARELIFNSYLFGIMDHGEPYAGF